MEIVPPRNFPTEKGTPVQELPLADQGPRPFYPPVCLKTHWDPGMILRHTLPDEHLSLPMDPRPWTRICMVYTTTGENQPAPDVPDFAALPSGGQFYPPTRYQQAIDNETQLRRLDRRLGIAEAAQYVPSQRGDLFNSRLLVPERKQPDSQFISELAFPKALIRAGPYPCRSAADADNLSRAGSLFNNATKQARYKQSFPTKKL